MAIIQQKMELHEAALNTLAPGGEGAGEGTWQGFFEGLAPLPCPCVKTLNLAKCPGGLFTFCSHPHYCLFECVSRIFTLTTPSL